MLKKTLFLANVKYYRSEANKANETAEAHNIVFAFIDFSSESTRPYLASYSLSCISEECKIKIFTYCASYVKINSRGKWGKADHRGKVNHPP